MEVNIKNLDLLPEEVRERFEQFLQNSFGDNSDDQEFKNYLINFLDDRSNLDAYEVWSTAIAKERFSIYQESNELDLQIMSAFNSPTDSNIDGEITANFEDELLNPFDEDSVLAEFTSNSNSLDIPDPDYIPSQDEHEINDATQTFALPESNLDVPPSFNDDNLAEHEEDIPFEKPTLEANESTNTHERYSGAEPHSELEDRLARLELAISQGAVQSAGAVGFPGGHPQGDLLDTLKKSASEIVSGGSKFTGGALSLGGAALSLGAKSASAIEQGLSHPKVKNFVTKSTGSLIEGTKGLFKGKRSALTGEMRALLTEMKTDNVVDIKARMSETISKHSKTSVERDLALLADKKISGKRNVLLGTISGIEEGKPNGRYTDIEVSKGITAGVAIDRVANGSEIEQHMARALVMNNDLLPDAATEMDFVAGEYKRIHETLESLTALAAGQGWTDEDIANQFGKPLEEWMDKRKPEDEMLAKLADIQNEGPDAELSPEELEQRKKDIDAMVEAIKRLIDKLFSRDNNQEESNSLSMSR